jgi:hypothetical protein
MSCKDLLSGAPSFDMHLLCLALLPLANLEVLDGEIVHSSLSVDGKCQWHIGKEMLFICTYLTRYKYTLSMWISIYILLL